MLGSLLLTAMLFILIFSTNFESPLKTIAQIDTKTAKQPQPSYDQNQTYPGFRETFKVIEDGNMSKSTILKLLSNVIETRLNKSAVLLELTSKLPEVTNISYANSITEKFKSIPQNDDLQKRMLPGIFLDRIKILLAFFSLLLKGTYTWENPIQISNNFQD